MHHGGLHNPRLSQEKVRQNPTMQHNAEMLAGISKWRQVTVEIVWNSPLLDVFHYSVKVSCLNFFCISSCKMYANRY